jgi:hypothetical protein
MELTQARDILKALLEGVDPVTGMAIPRGTVVHHASVLRALLSAVAVMEADLIRSRRRARLPENVGRPWKEPEDKLLLAAFSKGEPLTEVASRHRRSLAGVESRLEKLGVLAPEQRVTRNRYLGPRSSA